ncbi:MAG: hypothetical protein ACXADL_17045 [Candidatus Thorarchaeota archaeon]|jgi:hypothetical protein
MDELSFTEDRENHIMLFTTSKRKIKIKAYIPIGRTPFWVIVYEDGRPVEGLKGKWLTRRDVIKAVNLWDMSAKKTKDAKQFELFGDKKPPVLKRKQRVRGAAA